MSQLQIFPETPKVDWIGLRWTFFAFSALIVGASAISIATKGFNYGIDFTGGTFVQVAYSKPTTLADLRARLERAGYPDAMPQSFSGSNSFGIRLKGEQQLDATEVEKFITELKAAAPDEALTLERKEYVGPVVGRQLRRQAILAILGAMAAIIVYVAFRFSNPVWGAAGVLCIAHDVIATAGLFSITGKEVDLVIVAALLTIAGYSINDTIVIFDRMRERMRLYRREPMDVLINTSVNETLSRTLMTNMCVVTVVGTLFFFGGQVIHDFTTAMLFGGLIGTYSTIGVATPLVFQWEDMKGGRKAAASAPSAGASPRPDQPAQASKRKQR
ncbi:MAG: protein translocase subunit SecF [Elusimicrobia bacterium]|nr:protein translocase subunit SecF [Elusimicrobiota bacterium]